MVKKLVLALMFVSPLCTAYTPAQGDWQFETGVGATVFDADRNIEHSSPTYTFGVGRSLAPKWRYMVNFSHINGRTETTNRKLIAAGADLQFRRSFWTCPTKFTYDVILGAGFIKGPGYPKMDTMTRSLQAGLGATRPVTEHIRLGAKAVHHFARSGGTMRHDNQMLATATFSFPKGSMSAKRAQSRLNRDFAFLQKPQNTSTVLFGFDSDAVSEEIQPALAVMESYVLKHKDAKLMISGHTDAKGPAQYNEKLGERRAAAFKNFVTEKTHIPEAQIVLFSDGEAHPATTNETDEGRAQNRRIHAWVVPNDSFVESRS